MFGGAVSTYGCDLSARPQRVHRDRLAGREDELAEVHVPVALARPADVLPRDDGLPGRDHRVDVPVPEVPGVHESPLALGRREVHGAALDREDPVRALRRRARLGPVVAHRDVDSVVVDRALVRIGARVEERPANRMLAALRPDGPAPERVVVDLREVELPRDPLRHPSHYRSLPARREGPDG